MIVVVLGEIVQRLDRNGHPLANPLRIIRVVFIPALVVLLFAVLVMERNAGDTATRVATTGVWILVLFALLSLVTAHVFAEADLSTWRSQAPQLLVDILRVVLIAVGIALVLSTVWGTNLIGLFAALGVGGIAIGFALQDIGQPDGRCGDPVREAVRGWRLDRCQ